MKQISLEKIYFVKAENSNLIPQIYDKKVATYNESNILAEV